MYLLVGLGNPEPEYSNTRHNMGFDVINEISERYHISVNKNKFDGLYVKTKIEDQEVVVLKPQTYMNLSGKSVIQFMHFYKVKPEQILVVYDDIDIQPGIVKIRKKGGPGTHNGMKSVVQEIGTEEFPRIRVGIGVPQFKGDLIGHVIHPIPKEERQTIEHGVKIAADAVIEILKNGIDSAMNKFN